MNYEPVIGLEVHAELQTRSKMFCACPVLDSTAAQPNSAVCPVCAGMPGLLPVVNQAAVELAMRVALALECVIAATSLFARKNYFYPDLPKGYQISQYEYPLAQNGRLEIDTPAGEKAVRIRRVHLEEDTGKLTHIQKPAGESYSLVDLNRAGVPLLEIVSEPDLHSLEEVRAYARELRELLRSLGASSADMEKGQIRFEANVSLRPEGSTELGTRVEIKNLNSFRAMERAIDYELQRQAVLLNRGEAVIQETLGWNEALGQTISQRSKEEAHDYRYFPEPDLPPLVIEPAWIEEVRSSLPELPRAKRERYQREYQLTRDDAALLVSDPAIAGYFEAALQSAGEKLAPRLVANWICGELFAWMNQSGEKIDEIRVKPAGLVDLLLRFEIGEVNASSAKAVLGEMLTSGRGAGEIIAARELRQVSDPGWIAALVRAVLEEHPHELNAYLRGKVSLANWFFGQVMRRAGGKADPVVLQAELNRQLSHPREE